jgi:hypothetical protein
MILGLTMLSIEECKELIERDHDWQTSIVWYDPGVPRTDTHLKRTFKEAPVSVYGKENPKIMKEIITKYEVGDFCSLHKDLNWSFEYPGYAAYAVWITPLNDNYEGGELYFAHEPVKQVVGQTIKHSRRIRHEVKEVTKGTRYSLVSWVFREQELVQLHQLSQDD